MKEIIKEYFIEKYKQLDEMTETIHNTGENPFLNDQELRRLEAERGFYENVESELEEWILEREASEEEE